MKKDAAALLVLAALCVLLTWPLVLRMGDHVGHDVYDPSYALWAMSWTPHALGTGLGGLVNGNIFYPHTGTLYYADPVFGLSLLAAPLALATGNPVFAYNVLLLLAFFLAGAGMYALALRLTGSRAAAFPAAVIFAFFPYAFAHIMHLELLTYGWMPLCLLFLHRFFDDPTWRNALGAGCFFVLQVVCCAYYGQFLAIFAGLLFLARFIGTGAWRKGAVWVRAGGLAAFLAAILGPYVIGFLAVHRRMFFERPLWEIKWYSADLQHFFAVPPWNTLLGWLLGSQNSQEWQLYPGLVPVVLTAFWFIRRSRTIPRPEAASPPRRPGRFRFWDAANAVLFVSTTALGVTGGFEATVLGLRVSARSLQNPVLLLLLSVVLRLALDPRTRASWRRFGRALTPAQRYYAVLVALSWLLSFGPVVRAFGREIAAGPYALLYRWAPGFTGLRVPSRFFVLTMLGLALFSAWGVAALLEKVAFFRRRAVVVGLVSILVLAEYAAVPVPLVRIERPRTAPAIYEEVRKLPALATLIELPMPARDAEEFEDAVPTYRSTFHWRRIVNGYSGYAPPAYRVVREAMERFPDRKTFDLLERLEVGYILVHTSEYRARKGQEIAAALEAFARRATLLARAGGDLLFRVNPYDSVHVAERPVPPHPPRVAGDRTLWKAEANLNSGLASLAVDGDPRTFWSTGYPQREGDQFQLDLGRPETFSRLELSLAGAPLDFPRSFAVEASLDGADWTEIDRDLAFFPDLTKDMVEDFSRYEVLALFAPREVRYLRIRLLGSHPSRHWSISEVLLLGDD